jgi:hypothetical protein
MGQLIPAFCTEMSPGDTFILNNEEVLRFQPLVAPIMHEVNVYTHTFFCPLRLLFDEWEEFITGGVDGDTDIPLPVRSDAASSTVSGKYTLWDYFGFPVGINPEGAYPLLWPWRAYNLVWNEYYRDETLQEEVDLDQPAVLRRNWEKDYFTASLTSQQRGTPPAIPITGIGSAVWDDADFFNRNGSSLPVDALGIDSSGVDPRMKAGSSIGVANLKNFFNSNEIDLSNIGTFNWHDLRVVAQITKWQERNMRAGVRYNEFLKAHYPAWPRDERLQRPEYVGGSKSPLIVSEVLQTSSTDSTTPQGNLAGHGVTADRTHIAKYTAQEHGIIITMFSVMPRTNYQQGINRMWLRRTRYDYYFPEFAHLSEQGVMMAELYATNSAADNLELFGYQGRYDELRYLPSYVTADMRDTFDYWHLSRKFATKPLLNSDFIACNPDKRIFAVPSEHGIIVNYATVLKAIRPMPIIAEPGLADHF